jgi:hypothetical protein
MGCNCKKKPKVETKVIKTIPQTPEELHAQEMKTYIDNLPQPVEEDKQQN